MGNSRGKKRREGEGGSVKKKRSGSVEMEGRGGGIFLVKKGKAERCEERVCYHGSMGLEVLAWRLDLSPDPFVY